MKYLILLLCAMTLIACGKQGEDGERGFHGTQGKQGDKGPQGMPGSQGIPGIPGISCVEGKLVDIEGNLILTRWGYSLRCFMPEPDETDESEQND